MADSEYRVPPRSGADPFSTSQAVKRAVMAHWQALHPDASLDEIEQIIADDKAAVKAFLQTLPQSFWERMRDEIIRDLFDDELAAMVAEGKATVRYEDDEKHIAPTKGTLAAFERTVTRRIAKKMRDQDAQWKREGAYD
jgi:hypothetical protein